ncbi:hypothetical protein ERO13_A11G301525v2 [Gossypium hirsutum]|nr:hypothetical protein ERO13_A11G301525v2 [Gossypium hirsutum]
MQNPTYVIRITYVYGILLIQVLKFNFTLSGLLASVFFLCCPNPNSNFKPKDEDETNGLSSQWRHYQRASHAPFMPTAMSVIIPKLSCSLHFVHCNARERGSNKQKGT